MIEQGELELDPHPTARIISVGPHNWPTLEVDISAEAERQLEALWRVCAWGQRQITDPNCQEIYDQKQRDILGFNWLAEFTRRHPAKCVPCLTFRVTS